MAELKISIPYADLVRLIGDDSEVNVELRSHIALEFSKRHLKTLANDPGMEKLLHAYGESLRAESVAALSEYFTTSKDRWGANIVYNATAKLKGQVKAEVNSCVNQVIRDMVDDAINKRLGTWQKYIEECVSLKINKDYNDRINTAIKERLAKVADAVKE